MAKKSAGEFRNGMTLEIEGKVYQVSINGQTGEIHGGYPKSPIKIAALVIAIAALIGAIVYGYYTSDATYEYDSYPYESSYDIDVISDDIYFDTI